MLISFATKIVARMGKGRFDRWYRDAEGLQERVFSQLLEGGRRTQFGKEHGFDRVNSYDEFVQRVPIRDYEGFRPYVDRIFRGESDVLWPGRPLYFSKTSGTTSGAKYIPISRESMPYHVLSARNALLMYALKTGQSDFVRKKMIFISGSPELDGSGDIPVGRLSGISHRHVPAYLRRRRLPSHDINCISDWERKLDAVVEESLGHRLSLISGIPPWVEMYFERLLKHSGKQTVSEVFPDFSLFVYGGVNFQPYEKKFLQLIGKEIPSLETFPASEGFIGFQDEWPSEGLLLIPDAGIFFEFVPAESFYDENPPRIPLSQVQEGVNYVLILNTNAGLWSYNIGDTIRFVSRRPYRFIPTGRLSHYTSAFGEHVIAQEAEDSITQAAEKSGAVVSEFTLAPLVDNPAGLPCHQWFVEFSKAPADMQQFATFIDQALQERNPYYRDLVKGKILQPAVVEAVPRNTFRAYMKSIGKLGGQNKVPHLSNDRTIADWMVGHMQKGKS